MFAPRSHVRHPASYPASGNAPAWTRRRLASGATLRLALLILPMAAAPLRGASAQALGTMQVTARVLPGLPLWAGIREAQALAERVQRAPFSGSKIRQEGLVRARVDVASAPGRRCLLITVDYPRN